MARLDPHSCFDDLQPRTQRWHLRFLVDFDRKVLNGEATLLFKEPAAGILDLDSKGLTIHRAWVSATGVAVPFELGPEEPSLGRRLRLDLPAATGGVSIAYETAPDAIGHAGTAPGLVRPAGRPGARQAFRKGPSIYIPPPRHRSAD